MFIRPSSETPASKPAEASSLLKLVAGEFAPQVAARWPAPHTAFLTAPAARRHLVCLALLNGLGLAEVGDAILADRLRRVLTVAAPDAPSGLARALERMGDVAWPAEGYRQLLALLANPPAAKVLRHAEAVDLQLVQRMAALPSPMAHAVELAATLNPSGVTLLREAYDAITVREGAESADAAARRWAELPAGPALSAAVKDDLCPELPPLPLPGTARLRPLTSKAAIRDAARRYQNCLEGRLPHAASGWSAYYEWVGSPPAIVEITRDHIFGWRLDEARLPNNVPVPDAQGAEIVAELAAMGVHVGRSGWEVDRALSQIVGPAYPVRPVDLVVREAFGHE